MGLRELAPRLRRKTRVIYQSCEPIPRQRMIQSCFEIVISGHLREEKDPFCGAEALGHLPAESRIRITHIGGERDPAMAATARRWMKREPRYVWLDELARPQALATLARARAMLISSRMEGGANVILDIVGGPNIEKNFKAASHDARIIQLAFGAGSKVEINLMPVMLKRLVYTGSTLRTRPDAFKARIARELESQVWPLIAAGKIRVVTHSTLPLADAAKAHALMESGQHTGKILLKVA